MKRLSRKLLLEERVRNDDGAGGFQAGWLALGTHWGAVAPASGRLERGDGVARSSAVFRITVRSLPQTSPARPKPGQRLREGARIYVIRTVSEGRDARYLVCTVVEEVGS